MFISDHAYSEQMSSENISTRFLSPCLEKTLLVQLNLDLAFPHVVEGAVHEIKPYVFLLIIFSALSIRRSPPYVFSGGCMR